MIWFYSVIFNIQISIYRIKMTGNLKFVKNFFNKEIDDILKIYLVQKYAADKDLLKRTYKRTFYEQEVTIKHGTSHWSFFSRYLKGQPVFFHPRMLIQIIEIFCSNHLKIEVFSKWRRGMGEREFSSAVFTC